MMTSTDARTMIVDARLLLTADNNPAAGVLDATPAIMDAPPVTPPVQRKTT